MSKLKSAALLVLPAAAALLLSCRWGSAQSTLIGGLSGQSPAGAPGCGGGGLAMAAQMKRPAPQYQPPVYQPPPPQQPQAAPAQPVQQPQAAPKPWWQEPQ